MVLAPEHSLLTDLQGDIENFAEVTAYQTLAKKKSEIERTNATKEKTGVELKGIKAVNPATGEEIPVFVADYVLAGYGTGAIMAVPAHDERDFAFAKQYDLKIQPVIENGLNRDAGADDFFKLIDSGEFTGLTSEEAKLKIVEKVGGRMTKTYRLRDWGVSRQRYWGCPIPLIHCETCGWQAVPDKELPVVLPEVDNYLPNDNGQSPLSKNSDFVNTTCPGCGDAATRETDTLDTFVDSSWYFLRYCDALNTETFASKEALAKWMPVDLYSGGAEHTTMHLLYSRFFHKALFDLGLVNESEPYAKRMNRGLILGPDGNKMSKSKGNVIDPDAIVAELGADTMRMYLAFIGPYNETGNYPWNPESVIGVYRFLERVWRLQEKVTNELPAEQQAAIESSLHKALAMVSESIASMKMNTGVAALMTCSNELRTFEGILPEHLALYVQMLAPYAPHIADELWQILGKEGSVHQSSWPIFDATKSAEATVQVAVQVNGKVRGLLTLTGEESEAEVREMALADSKVATAIGEHKIKKVIIIPRKIVSIVV
jgi:leucyl-tRNA synthetase